jgi:hypothetical protein
VDSHSVRPNAFIPGPLHVYYYPLPFSVSLQISETVHMKKKDEMNEGCLNIEKLMMDCDK